MDGSAPEEPPIVGQLPEALEHGEDGFAEDQHSEEVFEALAQQMRLGQRMVVRGQRHRAAAVSGFMVIAIWYGMAKLPQTVLAFIMENARGVKGLVRSPGFERLPYQALQDEGAMPTGLFCSASRLTGHMCNSVQLLTDFRVHFALWNVFDQPMEIALRHIIVEAKLVGVALEYGHEYVFTCLSLIGPRLSLV